MRRSRIARRLRLVIAEVELDCRSLFGGAAGRHVAAHLRSFSLHHQWQQQPLSFAVGHANAPIHSKRNAGWANSAPGPGCAFLSLPEKTAVTWVTLPPGRR